MSETAHSQRLGRKESCYQMLDFIISIYSEACLRRPLKGPSKRGRCVQVVSLSRFIRLEVASLGPGCSGPLGQVVALAGFTVHVCEARRNRSGWSGHDRTTLLATNVCLVPRRSCVYQCLLQRRVSRVIHPVGRRLDPVENIVPGHL